jgi:hypothetical protein
MSYVISKNENNTVLNIFDPEIYLEPNVETFPITDEEFELMKNSFTFALWQYVDGKIVQSVDYDSIMKQKFNNEQSELRQKAYMQYSDPIFMQYQRGTATKEEWEAKVAEIKTWYPYQV